MIDDLEHFRDRLLVLIHASGRAGLDLDYLHTRLRPRGYPKLTAERLDDELGDLEARGLVEVFHPGLDRTPRSRRWKLLPAGRDYLESRNLIS